MYFKYSVSIHYLRMNRQLLSTNQVIKNPWLIRIMDFWDMVIVLSLSIMTFCGIFIFQIQYIKHSHNNSDNLTDYGYVGALCSLLPYIIIRIVSGCIHFQSISNNSFNFYGRVFGEAVVWLDTLILALFWFVGSGKLSDMFGFSQEYDSMLLILLYFIGYFPMLFLTFLVRKIIRICCVKYCKLTNEIIDDHYVVISPYEP